MKRIRKTEQLFPKITRISKTSKSLVILIHDVPRHTRDASCCHTRAVSLGQAASTWGAATLTPSTHWLPPTTSTLISRSTTVCTTRPPNLPPSRGRHQGCRWHTKTKVRKKGSQRLLPLLRVVGRHLTNLKMFSAEPFRFFSCSEHHIAPLSISRRLFCILLIM